MLYVTAPLRFQRLFLPYRLCSQDSVLATLYVVPMGRVSLPQRGATARVTAQTAATNPHPVVGGPKRNKASSFMIDWCHAERIFTFFNFNAAFFLDDDPRFTSDREKLLRRQRRLQPRVCRWSQRSTMCMSCRLWALYQLDRLSRCVCVCLCQKT